LIDRDGTGSHNQHVRKRQGQQITPDTARDDPLPWTLEDGPSQDVAAVLATLREVERRSGGRVRHLTRREARLVAIYQAAGQDPWTAYVAARDYVARADRGEDLTEETLAVARSTGEPMEADSGDELEIDYPAGMINPFVKTGAGHS
jgi:hypothetical protein